LAILPTSVALRFRTYRLPFASRLARIIKCGIEENTERNSNFRF